MESIREQWLILISTPLYLFIIGLEILLTHLQHKKAYTIRDTFTNIYLMLLNGGIDLLFRVVTMAVWVWFYHYSNVAWHAPVAYWVWLVIAEDFIYYWLHRFDHEVRFFWATHVTHHSSQKINFTVGFRSSVFQPLYRFIYFIPLALCGFKPLDIAFVYSATQIWGIFVHTELIKKMGWLEYIFVTPSHHRVHHASNPKYLDKNMGMFLIIWDKMFGTFQAELPDNEYQPIKYGLTKNLENPNAVTIVFHEWQQLWKDIRRKDISFRDKWNYVFGPPGWSHDGSRQTSEQMRNLENTAGWNYDKADTKEDLQVAIAYAANNTEEKN
ncbi:sterol desaturase family protein [Panacibacter sp. DH6]|uniref:Sterol desaturase family protein n=1 Tax=Panacibacter microcysteis TaxID=2793269 RepID=A0A931GVY4_9BACT|nr:sterol desaturase family protein [Panacibacter microcysteis]MBG9376945.1 sterol desaturase family protein [Panacibacter microcysteis]